MTRATSETLRLGFVCVRNAGRSQMAAAFAEREREHRGFSNVEVLTGGTHPAECVHSEVLTAMREVGIDLADREPQAIETDELRSCTCVATMGCSTLELDDAVGVDVRDWDLPDPEGKPIERVRTIRDEIERRVQSLFDAFSGVLELRRVEANERASVEKRLVSNDLPVADLEDVELFVGVVDDEWVGVGGLERDGSNALLRSVVVEESARGQGYGSTLVRRLLVRARDLGVEDVYLLTTTAAGFFTSLGFEEIERDRVPTAIRATQEFEELCPQSAACLHKRLG